MSAHILLPKYSLKLLLDFLYIVYILNTKLTTHKCTLVAIHNSNASKRHFQVFWFQTMLLLHTAFAQIDAAPHLVAALKLMLHSEAE